MSNISYYIDEIDLNLYDFFEIDTEQEKYTLKVNKPQELISIFHLDTIIKLKQEYLEPFSKDSIKNFIDEIILFVNDFEEMYRNFILHGTTTTIKKTKNLYIEDSPSLESGLEKTYNIYNKAITIGSIEETIIQYSENLLSLYTQMFDISGDNNKLISSNEIHSFRINFKEIFFKEPVILPIKESSYIIEPAIVTPNFSKKFYIRGTENINMYQTYNINSLNRVMADLISTMILIKSQNPTLKMSIGYILFILSFFNSREYIKTLIRNSDMDEINEIKNDDDFFEYLFDKIYDIQRTSSLMNHIVNNLRGIVFDKNLGDLAVIISTKPDKASSLLREFIINSINDASLFCLNNNIPRIEYIIRSQSYREYKILGTETVISEIRSKINEAPANSVYDSSEQIIDTESIIKNLSPQLITRKVKVYDGTPFVISVSVSPDGIVNYHNEKLEIDFNNTMVVNIPVSNWNDAVIYSEMMKDLNSVKLLNRQCEVVIENNNKLKELIYRLITDTVDSSISYDSKNKLAKISYSGIYPNEG